MTTTATTAAKQFSEIPERDAITLVNWAYDEAHDAPPKWALEPSAGNGALLKVMRNMLPSTCTIYALEIDPKRAEACEALNLPNTIVLNVNFLKWVSPILFDVICMNPPVYTPNSPRIYTQHVKRAIIQLGRWGTLAAITPAGWAGDAVGLRKIQDLTKRAKWRSRLSYAVYNSEGVLVPTFVCTVGLP